MTTGIREMIRDVKIEILETVREWLANRIEWGPFTISSATGNDDKIAGYPSDGEDDQDYEHEVKRMQHFGFRSRPPKDTWAVFLGVGGGATNKASVAEDSDKYGPSDLDDGEVALYNKVSGALIKIDKDGNIAITAGANVTITAAANKNVVLNSGELKNARVTDPLAVGTLTGQAGPYPVVFTYIRTENVDGVDTPGTPVAGQSVSLTGIISNSGGAPHVKS